MDTERLGRSLRSHALGALAVFIALGGTAIAASGPSGGGADATASAVSGKKFKKLKRKVAGLERRIDEPVSGSISGRFPDLSIRRDAVGAAEIVAGGVGTEELASRAVTRAKFQDNITQPLDFANTNAGTCSTASFIADGVAPGDLALVAPPANTPASIVTQAYVVDVDNLVIKVCNVGANAEDPPAADYLVTIVR